MCDYGLLKKVRHIVYSKQKIREAHLCHSSDWEPGVGTVVQSTLSPEKPSFESLSLTQTSTLIKSSGKKTGISFQAVAAF